MTDPKFPPRTTLYFKMGDHKPRTTPSMNSVAVPMISVQEHERLIREACASAVELAAWCFENDGGMIKGHDVFKALCVQAAKIREGKA